MDRLLIATLVAACVAQEGYSQEAPRGGVRNGGESWGQRWGRAPGGIGTWNGQRYPARDSAGGGYYFRPGRSYVGWDCYPGYDVYAPYVGIYPPAPVIYPVEPDVFQPFSVGDAQLQQLIESERNAGSEPAVTFPVEELPKRFIKPSTPDAQRRSVRLEHDGDLQFQGLQFGAAARKYREAMLAAEDRPAPYFRLALAEAALGDFREAARLYKLGMQLDPGWPEHAPTLDVLFGQQNLLTKVQVKHRVAEWAAQDVHDADRLFLLGVLLHTDGDELRGRHMFETAALLVGDKPYLTAFLDATSGVAQAGEDAEGDAAGNVPPPPPAPDGAGLKPPPATSPRLNGPVEPPVPPAPVDP